MRSFVCQVLVVQLEPASHYAPADFASTYRSGAAAQTHARLILETSRVRGLPELQVTEQGRTLMQVPRYLARACARQGVAVRYHTDSSFGLGGTQQPRGDICGLGMSTSLKFVSCRARCPCRWLSRVQVCPSQSEQNRRGRCAFLVCGWKFRLLVVPFPGRAASFAPWRDSDILSAERAVPGCSYPPQFC